MVRSKVSTIFVLDEKELDDYNSDEVYEEDDQNIQEPGFKMLESNGIEEYGSVTTMLDCLRK